MLHLVGMGMSIRDLTIRSISTMQNADRVFIETYTNKFDDIKKLEKMVGVKVELLERKDVESAMLVKLAQKEDIVLLVLGDALSATTHLELLVEAKKAGVETKVLHAPSILTAVAKTGLSLYKFGRVTTLVYPYAKEPIKSPYDVIMKNQEMGLHTLVLLDITEDKKYMTVKDGLEIIKKLDDGKINEVFGCHAVGTEDEEINFGDIDKLIQLDNEKTPACIVIPGDINEKEGEDLEVLHS